MSYLVYYVCMVGEASIPLEWVKLRSVESKIKAVRPEWQGAINAKRGSGSCPPEENLETWGLIY